jgi:DNA uptake protein ComE-like DNA-binding protein
MKTQQFFICQLHILFLFGIMVIVLSILSHGHHLEKRIAIKDAALQLVWKGNALIVNNQGDMEHQRDDTALLPSNITPLFFQPIPINNADFELLLTIPGVGPKLAGEIGVVKKRLGRFKKHEELLLVNGIGRKKMNILKDYFTFQ